MSCKSLWTQTYTTAYTLDTALYTENMAECNVSVDERCVVCFLPLNWKPSNKLTESQLEQVQSKWVSGVLTTRFCS